MDFTTIWDAIALGILVASGQLKAENLDRYEFAGELSLSGELRRVRGALAMCVSSRKSNRTFVLPRESAAEAVLSDATVIPAKSLLEVCAHLSGSLHLDPAIAPPQANYNNYPDLADIKGQMPARRALEIAAAGSHSLLSEFTICPI